MTTSMATLIEKNETADEAKARRNAEYEAKLEESFRQADNGEIVQMTFEEWEEKFGNG